MPAKPRHLLTAPEAWGVVARDPFDRHGEIQLTPGHLEIAAGNPGSGLVYRGPLPRTDYRITLEAQRTAGEDFFCGLTFPIGSQHATLIIGGWGGGVTGISNIDGMSAIENPTTSYTPFENDRWYKIELRVTEPLLVALVDGEEILSVDAEGRQFNVWPELEPMRPLGIATWKTAATIRRMQLERV
ncbi:family 16 glycoside hydrolase [Candidatus Laterigemmans baculatus]|uniref:family 16 glycoside hydrolase n=1 Tax=Candidatus Laterigemmans baculatus TaxID=2770505 RepID=UPI0013D9BE9E|nr:family 16 glycoside hydrolase [Candidatus Laterigemmans baculatus]